MKKLLFIEDDIITGSVYKYHFNSAGYQVHLADNAEQGLAALARLKPDALDLMLPGMNGVDFIKRLRAQPETQSLPIIVFTNAYVSGMIKDAENAGATRCLIKADTGSKQLLIEIAQTLASPGPPASPGSTKSTPLAPPPDPRAEFVRNAPQLLQVMRGLSQKLLATEIESSRPAWVSKLFKTAHGLTTQAAIADAPRFGQMVSALEALLKELEAKPKEIGPSAMRTINHAIEFLARHFDSISSPAPETPTAFKILAVDDEMFSRKAVTGALARAQLSSTEVENPMAAYELLRRERFNLVITDVQMPGLDGFQLCEKLRALPGYADTPVIFVTALNGFEARVRSARSGGDDFIGKPFLYLELAVKALTHLMRGLLKPASGFQSFRPPS